MKKLNSTEIKKISAGASRCVCSDGTNFVTILLVINDNDANCQAKCLNKGLKMLYREQITIKIPPPANRLEIFINNQENSF